MKLTSDQIEKRLRRVLVSAVRDLRKLTKSAEYADAWPKTTAIAFREVSRTFADTEIRFSLKRANIE